MSDNAVKWSWGDLCFEFRCDHPEILALVKPVVSRWERAVSGGSPALISSAIPHSAGGWYFTGSQPEAEGYCADAGSVVRAVESDATLAVLHRPDLFITVHGALLWKAGAGVLLVGPSLAGKSTLAWALFNAGWQLAGDDVTVLESDNARCWQATALPRRLSLRNTSKALVGQEKWNAFKKYDCWQETEEGIVFFPDRLHGNRQRVLLRAVVFLEVETREPSEIIRKIHPADGLLRLCPFTNIARYGRGMGECFLRLASLTESVPAFSLHRTDLDQMIKAVESMIGKPVGGDSSE